MKNLLILGTVMMALLLTLMLGFGAYTDDANKPQTQSDSTDQQTSDEQPDQPAADDKYAVPDAEPAKILEWLHELAATEPEGITRERRMASLKELQNAILRGADAVLAQRDKADQEVLLTAVQLKFRALRILHYMGVESAAEQLTEFAKALKSDPLPELATEAEFQLLAVRVDNFEQTADEDIHTLIQDLSKFLGDRPFNQGWIAFMIDFSEQLENTGRTAPAAASYEQIAALIAKSNDPRFAPMSEHFQAIARRLNLPGNTMEVEGKTIGGETFDWASYRGKVVLVDFWATWCGPCVAELPNVKRNYDLYHQRGFDVVGISLDDDLEQLQKFLEAEKVPWVTLVGEPGPEGELNHPAAQLYGVTGIPTVILVDKEGKVVSLEARGERLGELLAQLLGPAPDKTAESE